MVKTGGIVLFGVAGVLLLSMGGAIFAAPVTLPLAFVVVRRHPTRPFRLAGAVLGGLTAAEVAWAGVYVLAGEGSAAIWAAPLLTAAAAAAAVLLVRPATAKSPTPA